MLKRLVMRHVVDNGRAARRTALMTGETVLRPQPVVPLALVFVRSNPLESSPGGPAPLRRLPMFLPCISTGWSSIRRQTSRYESGSPMTVSELALPSVSSPVPFSGARPHWSGRQSG